MKIGLLLPSILMSKRYTDRIFAPKKLFLDLSEGLIKKSHQVYLYTTSNIKTSAELIYGNQLLEEKSYPSAHDQLKETHNKDTVTLLRNVHEYEIDLTSKAFTHAQTNQLDILHVYYGSFAFYFATNTSIKTVFTLHDPAFSDGSLENLRLKTFKDLEYVCISEKQKRMYEESLGLKINNMVYHGLDLRDFEYHENSSDYLAMIGRFIPSKGFSEGIEVAKKQNKILQIASTLNYQETEYYQKEIRPKIDGKKIILHEYLIDETRSKFIGEARALLFPINWEEPFGLVMIEAMACGTPIIAFAKGSVPEIVRDGETGFIVNFSEEDKRGNWIIKKTGIEGLCEAVEKIYSLSENQYRQMRHNCRELVERNFTVENMVANYEAVYSKILSTK